MIINCYLNAFLADFNSALFTAKFSGWIALMLACCSTISCDPDVDLSKTLALEWVLSHSSMNPSSKSLWPSLLDDLALILFILIPSVELPRPCTVAEKNRLISKKNCGFLIAVSLWHD